MSAHKGVIMYFEDYPEYIIQANMFIKLFGKENVVFVYPIVEKMKTEKLLETIENTKRIAKAMGVRVLCGDYRALVKEFINELGRDLYDSELDRTGEEQGIHYVNTMLENFSSHSIEKEFQRNVCRQFSSMFNFYCHYEIPRYEKKRKFSREKTYNIILDKYEGLREATRTSK